MKHQLKQKILFVGLKTLVSLHRAVDENGDVDALTEDEVTIIGAVLDLRAKPVSKIMTPIADCFVLSIDAVLDETVMDLVRLAWNRCMHASAFRVTTQFFISCLPQIVSAGYSRIPVHSPGDKSNFVGMLLVKQLIKYDPEDALPVSNFQISTLPETGPDTSCLDILNFFQEGRSHMALVSNNPGGENGVLGVITLEDVIEELIGEVLFLGPCK
jgi:CBS domain containing-hemolysin-like protein